MKYIKKILVAVLILLFAAVLSFVCLVIYEEQFRKEEVYRQSSPDGAYVFVLSQVGSPGWPFGPVKAQIEVRISTGKRMDKESIVVHTDGGRLSEYNIEKIQWHDTFLEVVCRGEDGDAAYVLEFASP